MRYHLEPISSKYIFTLPVTALQQITLSFRDPINRILLSPQILNGWFQSERGTSPLIGGVNLFQSVFWIQSSSAGITRNGLSSFAEYIEGAIYYIRFIDLMGMQTQFQNINNDPSVVANLVNFLTRKEGM
jgi:hypothetical protein